MSRTRMRNVQFRATSNELEAWQQAAEREQKTLSDWIRARLNRHDLFSAEVEILTKVHHAIENQTTMIREFLETQGKLREVEID